MLTAARHSDPVRQSDASAMLCAYASRAPSEADLQLLVDPLGDALAKKQAKTPVEKEGAVRALQGVAAAASARGERLETCAASVVDKLVSIAHSFSDSPLVTGSVEDDLEHIGG